MTSTILAIETSNKFCSLALQSEVGISELRHEGERGHTKQVLPLLEELLAQSQISLQNLSAIAYGKGPGSFTGLRVGLSFAQGLAFALDVPLLAVSSLKTLAYTAYHTVCGQSDGTYVTAFDARMGEVYLAVFTFENGCVSEVVAPALLPLQAVDIATFFHENQRLFLVGSAFSQLKDMKSSTLASFCFAELEPSAQYMLYEAQDKFHAQQFVNVEQPEITYLRDNIVQS